MASYYVYSGAGGAGTGADWANAFTTLAAAVSGKAVSDIFYVADDHAETQASAMTITSPGTAASPCLIYCVRRTGGSVPPVSADLRTTGTVTTTGAFAMTLAGSARAYGLTFSAGSGATNAVLTVGSTNSSEWVLEDCGLKKLGTTANTAAITPGNGNPSKVTLINCTLEFGAVGDGLFPAGTCIFTMRRGSITGATIPTSLIQGAVATMVFEGVDLSALGSGKSLCVAAAGCYILFKDCKLDAAVSVIAAALTNVRPEVYVVRSDSGATISRSEKYSYRGTLTTETSIVHTGGSSDGTTPVSHKIVASAQAKWITPFESPPIPVWNSTIAGNITVTLEGTINAGAVPNNDDIWIFIEYLGSALTPLGSFATAGKADGLATGSALTSSGESWGGGGSGGGWSPFKLTKTFTAPAMAGWIYVYVRVGKASTTYYVDPKVVVS